MDIWDKASNYSPLIPPSFFSLLAVVFLLGGFFSASTFLLYELTAVKNERNFVKQVASAVPASLLLSFGAMMLMQTAGLYL